MNQCAALTEILQVSADELQGLLNRPDDADGMRKRAQVRIPYHMNQGIDIDVLDPDGDRTRVLVAPRDISRGGIGVLHRGPLAGGTAVVVHLPTSAGADLAVRGRVVCCFGVAGQVYNVGIAFDDEIETVPIIARAQYLHDIGHC